MPRTILLFALLTAGTVPVDAAACLQDEPGSVQDTSVVQDSLTSQDTAGSSGPGPVQDSLANPPIPPDRAELDSLLQDDLLATFHQIPGLETVEVEVEAGVVALRGTVLTAWDRMLADSLARQAGGVYYVDNRIVEETSLELRIRSVFRDLREKVFAGLAYLPLLLVAGAVVTAFFYLGLVVSRWKAPFGRLSRNPFLQNLLRQVAAGGVGFIGILLALELLGITALVGAVLGAAGVAGIAIGFAFRNIAENYLAGIILSLRQPFAPDDQILVEGQEGKVIRLTSRETFLMTLDGNHVRIPNAVIFNSIIQNLTQNPLRRFRFDLSVAQSEDLVRVHQIATETLTAMPAVLDVPPPQAITTEVGDSAVSIGFFGWVDQTKVSFDKVRSEAIRLTKGALDTAGVAMPPPEYGLRMLDGGGAKAPEDVEEEVQRRTRPEPGPGETQPPAGTEPATDLEPDRAVDEQIARERKSLKEEDLLQG